MGFYVLYIVCLNFVQVYVISKKLIFHVKNTQKNLLRPKLRPYMQLEAKIIKVAEVKVKNKLRVLNLFSLNISHFYFRQMLCQKVIWVMFLGILILRFN